MFLRCSSGGSCQLPSSGGRTARSSRRRSPGSYTGLSRRTSPATWGYRTERRTGRRRDRIGESKGGAAGSGHTARPAAAREERGAVDTRRRRMHANPNRSCTRSRMDESQGRRRSCIARHRSSPSRSDAAGSGDTRRLSGGLASRGAAPSRAARAVRILGRRGVLTAAVATGSVHRPIDVGPSSRAATHVGGELLLPLSQRDLVEDDE
jgi:hypothetical protein